jgi:hypothetical protein
MAPLSVSLQRVHLDDGLKVPVAGEQIERLRQQQLVMLQWLSNAVGKQCVEYDAEPNAADDTNAALEVPREMH